MNHVGVVAPTFTLYLDKSEREREGERGKIKGLSHDYPLKKISFLFFFFSSIFSLLSLLNRATCGNITQNISLKVKKKLDHSFKVGMVGSYV